MPLHLLCKNDGSRLRNLRWCPTENREIPWDEVVRGYEIGKEEHVVLSASDLESLPLRTAHTIEILQFCARDEVPDLYLDRAYYVEPEEVGRRPYALLRNFRMVARVLRAFWIQFVLLGLGAAALIAFADLLASQQGTSWVKGLLATAGITGFSVAGLSAKLKNEAQALLLRLRQDAYTDLIAVDITTAPQQPIAGHSG